MGLKYIGTTNGRYLTAEVEDKGETLLLKGAVKINKDCVDVGSIALCYINQELYGEIPIVTVYKTSLESIIDAKDESLAIGVMRNFVPDAERKSRAKLVATELSTLLKTIIK